MNKRAIRALILATLSVYLDELTTSSKHGGRKKFQDWNPWRDKVDNHCSKFTLLVVGSEEI